MDKIIRPIHGTKFDMTPDDKKRMERRKVELKFRDDKRRGRFDELLKERINNEQK